MRGTTASIRVAILSATWKCNIYDVDDRGKLFRSAFHSGFRLMDIAWMPGLHSSGLSTLLSGITEEGNVVIIEVEVPEIVRLRANASLFSVSSNEKKQMDRVEDSLDVLSGHASVATTLALPKSLTLMLRLLLQVGLPLSVLEAVLDPDSVEEEAAALEEQIWEKFPVHLKRLGSNGGSQTLSVTSPSTDSVPETPPSNRICDEKSLADAKKRARRRVTLMEVSRGMSLASEVYSQTCLLLDVWYLCVVGAEKHRGAEYAVEGYFGPRKGHFCPENDPGQYDHSSRSCTT